MNNPMFKLVAVLVLILGGLWFGLSSYRSKSTEYEHKLGMERIRREYLERAPFARTIEAPDRYKDDQRALFKWYFSELSDHYNKFPKFKNFDRYEDELADRKAKGKLKEGDAAQYEERYKMVKDFWELVRAGKYEPVFTAGDKGLRFDVYDIRPTPGTREPTQRLAFALYGTQRKLVTDSSGGAKVSKLSVNISFREMALQGFDEKDKPITEMRASGDPMRIDNPERFIEEFPPGIVIGYYDIPKIPATVAKADLSFTLGTRSVVSGEESYGTFTWKFNPVPQEWKLPAGMAWEGATETVRGGEGQ